MGFALCDPGVREVAAEAARRLAEAAGLVLDEEPVALSDPVKAWLGAGPTGLWHSLEDGMWPGVADDLTRYSRSVLEQTERQTVPWVARTEQRRERLVYEVAALFEEVDLLLSPTNAVAAFAAEGPPPDTIDGQVARPLGASATPFTMLANLCWNPAVSVPAGLNSEGLPVGLQITARRHHDEIPLRLARIWEQTQPWERQSRRSRR
jgi:aspartyl-tRNA(Asn)/glutamyl-tRNA(Gln) amidotransferase subunit A